MFNGSITALITPFRDGGVDESAFQEFVDWQIKEGVHGVVPCGTSGLEYDPASSLARALT